METFGSRMELPKALSRVSDNPSWSRSSILGMPMMKLAPAEEETLSRRSLFLRPLP